MSEFASPLAGAPAPAPPTEMEARVTLRESPPAGMVLVGAWPETLAATEDALADIAADDWTILPIAPGRFLVVGEENDPMAVLASRLDVETACVTDVGHARSRFRLSGPKAAEVLGKGLAIDLHPDPCPPGSTLQSAIHHVGVILHRRDLNGFELFVFRGFALSFFEWLTDAAAEFGCRVEPGAS